MRLGITVHNFAPPRIAGGSKNNVTFCVNSYGPGTVLKRTHGYYIFEWLTMFSLKLLIVHMFATDMFHHVHSLLANNRCFWVLNTNICVLPRRMHRGRAPS